MESSGRGGTPFCAEATPSISGRCRLGGGAGGSSSGRERVRGGGGGGGGGGAAFSVYCDDKENWDPSTGLLARFARTAASPLTPGAAAAASRDAATATPPPAAAAEDPKSRDGGGGTRTPRRSALSDITQWVEQPVAAGKKGRTRAYVHALDGDAGGGCADAVAAAGRAGAPGLQASRPGAAAPRGSHSSVLRHSMR